MFTRLVLAVALLSASAVQIAQARSSVAVEGVDSRVGSITLAELPPQGRTTHDKIMQGGPFPYDKDGTVFGNRERLLPGHPRGYYREYTVKSPGSRDRGARRIVCGGKADKPDACFYSDDHYTSFRKIVP